VHELGSTLCDAERDGFSRYPQRSDASQRGLTRRGARTAGNVRLNAHLAASVQLGASMVLTPTRPGCTPCTQVHSLPPLPLSLLSLAAMRLPARAYCVWEWR
jgi:hypothetical protein